LRLQGKAAIVTGAGRGIGKAIARKFLQEGAEVFVCDVDGDRSDQHAPASPPLVTTALRAFQHASAL
jgi:NAD(P)-dependent dehydrogenase (short-subunit alcohol dehydrogenase family)